MACKQIFSMHKSLTDFISAREKKKNNKTKYTVPQELLLGELLGGRGRRQFLDEDAVMTNDVLNSRPSGLKCMKLWNCENLVLIAYELK